MKLTESEKLIQYFVVITSAPDLANITLAYQDAAKNLAKELPENLQKLEALKSLLQSRDWAVRSLTNQYAPEA